MKLAIVLSFLILTFVLPIKAQFSAFAVERSELELVNPPLPKSPEADPDSVKASLLSGFKGFYGTPIKVAPSYSKCALPDAHEKAEKRYEIDLNDIRNKYLQTSLTFQTQKGNKVYVAGLNSANCPDNTASCAAKERVFACLSTEKGEKFFIKITDVLNWGFIISGSKTLRIDGDKYVVKVYADASENEDSELEIKGPKGVVFKHTLKEIADAINGPDIVLSRHYKLAYGAELHQGEKRGDAYFNEKYFLFFVPYPMKNSSDYYVVDPKDISGQAMTYPQIDPSAVFSLNGNTLFIQKP